MSGSTGSVEQSSFIGNVNEESQESISLNGEDDMNNKVQTNDKEDTMDCENDVNNKAITIDKEDIINGENNIIGNDKSNQNMSLNGEDETIDKEDVMDSENETIVENKIVVKDEIIENDETADKDEMNDSDKTTDNDEMYSKYFCEDSISEFSVESYGSVKPPSTMLCDKLEGRGSFARELNELRQRYDELSRLDNEHTQHNGARPLSRNIARRGRRRPGVVNQTLFQRGITFNGFSRRLEPEMITGHTFLNQTQLVYYVRWRGFSEKSFLIEPSLLRTYCPRMLINYFEKMVVYEFLRKNIRRYSYHKCFNHNKNNEL